ncbi:hypothetical protein PMAYCL1PPCAC_24683, partial [Pristionchus mayeri]
LQLSSMRRLVISFILFAFSAWKCAGSLTSICSGTKCAENCDKLNMTTLPSTDWRGMRHEMDCEEEYFMRVTTRWTSGSNASGYWDEQIHCVSNGWKWHFQYDGEIFAADTVACASKEEYERSAEEMETGNKSYTNTTIFTTKVTIIFVVVIAILVIVFALLLVHRCRSHAEFTLCCCCAKEDEWEVPRPLPAFRRTDGAPEREFLQKTMSTLEKN